MKKQTLITCVVACGLSSLIVAQYVQNDRRCSALESELAHWQTRAEQAQAEQASVEATLAESEEQLAAQARRLEDSIARADSLFRQNNHAKRELRKLTAQIEATSKKRDELETTVRSLRDDLVAAESTVPVMTDYERQRYENEIIQLRSRVTEPENRRSYSVGQTFSAPVTVKVLSISPTRDVVAFSREAAPNLRINERYALTRGDEFVAAVQVKQLRPQFAVAVVVSPGGVETELMSGETLTIVKL